MYSLFVGFWPALHWIYDKYYTHLYDKETHGDHSIITINEAKEQMDQTLLRDEIKTINEIRDKVCRNVVAFTNWIGSLLFCVGYYVTDYELLFNILIIYPLTYYIYDTYVIINKKLINDYNYIIHHTLTIIYIETMYRISLNDHEYIYELIKLFFMMELSNTLLYLVYHLLQKLKLEPNNIELQNKIHTIKKLQLGFYGPIRILYIPYFLHTNKEWEYLYELHILILTISFYIMGCYWFCNQCFILYKETKYKET